MVTAHCSPRSRPSLQAARPVCLFLPHLQHVHWISSLDSHPSQKDSTDGGHLLEGLDATGLPLPQFRQVPEPPDSLISTVPRTDDGRRTPWLDTLRPRPRRVQREAPTTHHVSLRRHPPAPAACSLPPCRRRPSSYLDRFIVHSAIAPPCNNGPAPRPPRLDLSSSGMASRDESGEPGASLSLPGSAGPISPTAPIRSLGSATDLTACRPRLGARRWCAQPASGDSRGTEAASWRRKAAMQRGESPQHSSAAHPPRPPGPDTPRRLRGKRRCACLLACDVATHAPTTTYEMHRLGGPECGVCACRLGRGGGLLRDASFDHGTGRDLDHLSPHGTPQARSPNGPEWV